MNINLTSALQRIPRQREGISNAEVQALLTTGVEVGFGALAGLLEPCLLD